MVRAAGPDVDRGLDVMICRHGAGVSTAHASVRPVARWHNQSSHTKSVSPELHEESCKPNEKVTGIETKSRTRRSTSSLSPSATGRSRRPVRESLTLAARVAGMLLDWTGRQLRADKRGAIPDHLACILDRLGLNRSNWVETVRGFGRLFKQAAGRSSSLVDAAARRSRCWFQGKAAAGAAVV